MGGGGLSTGSGRGGRGAVQVVGGGRGAVQVVGGEGAVQVVGGRGGGSAGIYVHTYIQQNLVKTNFRGPVKVHSSHYQKFFLSGYDTTCTVLQQTKQG